MSGKNIWLFVIALLVAGGLAGFFLLQRGAVDVGPSQEGRNAPVDIAFVDYAGNTVTLADFRGTPMVVNSWAAWCPFCVRELQAFGDLQEEFGDAVVVIAIDRAESLQTAKEFSDRVGVTERMIMLLDRSDAFYQAIGGFSMPETIFVDENGAIKDHKRGPMELDEMRRRTKQAFNL